MGQSWRGWNGGPGCLFCSFFIYLFKPLFNQVNPLEIKNLFFEGDLDQTGSNIRNA